MKPKFFLLWILFILLPLINYAQTSQKHSMMGMQNTPHKIILPLQINDQGFALELYTIVSKINNADGLSGTPNEISLLTWVSAEDQFLLDPNDSQKEPQPFPSPKVVSLFQDNIRKNMSIANDESIPYLDILTTPGDFNFSFFQDLFESFEPNLMLDLSQTNQSTEKSILEGLKQRLGVNVVKPLQVLNNEDDDGGNLEVTPEGIPYVGSSMSKALRSEIKNITGLEPIVLPTEWLFVSHVDEMLTFLPTMDSCGSTLIYANPLEAINFMREFGKVPLVPREDIEGIGATIINPEAYKKRFFNSLKYFTLESAIAKKSLSLNDFDRKKRVRDLREIPEQMDIEFLGNLHAYEQVQKAVSILQKNRPEKCLKNIVGIPSLYYNRGGVSFELENQQSEITTGYTAVSGYLNLISLRNHIVIANEIHQGHYLKQNENEEGELVLVSRSEQGFFGPIVRKRLAKILGGDSFVHTINAKYYEQGAGSVHCVTNVIRSSDKWSPNNQQK